MSYTDTHAHLAEKEFEIDIDEVIQRAKEADIKRIILIGCQIEGAKRALALAKRDPIFKVAVGFHPEDVLNLTDKDWEEMESLMRDPLVIAIGEIGLDFYWDKDPLHHEIQEKVFIRQIELANTLNKPILIHSRDSIQKTYDLLKAVPVLRKGVMHCYSSSLEMAKEFIKLGYMISLAGPVSFKNAHVPVSVALGIDLDHLLIETDSPYLTPHPYRGKRNESAYVRLVGEKIAELRGIDPTKLQEILEENYLRMFEKSS
jgi:TatD DNase family protein